VVGATVSHSTTLVPIVVAESITTGVSMSLKNKVAIATGENSGIGKAIALELAKTFWGWRVLHSGLEGASRG